jgi:hypothetical protein
MSQTPEVKFRCECGHELDWTILSGKASLKCPSCEKVSYINVDDRDAMAKQQLKTR